MAARGDDTVRLFLCGDVMTGRGVDQVLAHPSDPAIHEPYMTSALGYVDLAEWTHGHIARPVGPTYIWGEALAEFEARAPHARIVNLETAVTTSEDYLPKGINYRMQPENVGCLSAAGVDCCTLANNHVLDWGVDGLTETLDTLTEAGIGVVGAGRALSEASRPAVLHIDERRLLVFAIGSPTSGIPREWAATDTRPGVWCLPELSVRIARHVAATIGRWRREQDIVVLAVHWGGNWGYAIPGSQRIFAHELVDSGAVDVVHGHSCHHAKGIEVYNGRLILYGCGDFINDYEGITGHEEFRPDLVLGYFASLDALSGALASLEAVPFRSRRFRLERVPNADAGWLAGVLDRESRKLGSSVEASPDGTLELRW